VPTKKKPPVTAAPARRRELLDTAAEVFAEQGYNATTVRKIADHAGMLAGSLYYHFDSKESMLEEILRTFLDELWDGYDTVLDAEFGPRETLEALVTESFREIDRHRAAVAIYQKESKHLVAQERFAFLAESQRKFEKAWLSTLERGVAARGLPGRPRRPAHLPVRARHGVGRRVLVPAGRTAQRGGDRPAVPVDGAGRDRRTHITHVSVWGVDMAEAYIVEAVRTPVGRRGGGLSGVHPADLGAHVLKELVARSGIDPAAVEDVVFGCLDAVGPQAGDIARTAWLAAGLPEEVPGVTVDRQCGSSQQAVHFAAQGVLSGTQDLVVAGGVQNMSLIPIAFASRQAAAAGAHGGPVRGQRGLARAVRDAARQPVRRRRDDRREVGDQQAGPGGVRPPLAPAGPARDRRGPLRAGDGGRTARSPSTRGRAGTPRWRRWPA
jgi:AcrR family transcriptional regulator